jgi:translation initiation factor 2B subunit (eIF-2B alpha/beta/delta family)
VVDSALPHQGGIKLTQDKDRKLSLDEAAKVVENWVDDVNESVDDVKKRQDSVEKQLEELKKRVEKLEHKSRQEEDLDEL